MGFDQLAADLASRRVSAVELVDEALEKAEVSEHVFISLRTDAAREEALAADERRAHGEALSLVDGVPIAWKDLFDIAGTVTTAAVPIRTDVPAATADAPVVAATRRVGLIALGKTNLSQFAFSGIGYNPHFGTPFAGRTGGAGRIPGGSSSGSAVAVERGIVVAAMGTDTAGSVRLPAAFTGLVGYKASRARYPMDGVFPLATSFDSLGPIAKTVRDCVWMDAALRGEMAPAVVAEKPARVVLDADSLDDEAVSEPVRQNLRAFADRLAAAGIAVDIRPVATFAAAREALKTYGWLGATEAYQLHKETLAAEGEKIDPRVYRRLMTAKDFPPENAAELRRLRPGLIAELSRELDGALFLVPTVPFVAPELAPLVDDFDLFAKTNLAALSLTMPGSYLDTPGIAMPSGTDADGHPTSALFGACSGQDETLLAAGKWIEQHA